MTSLPPSWTKRGYSFRLGRAELVVPLEAPLEALVLRCALEGEGRPSFDEGLPLSALDQLVAERGAFLLTLVVKTDRWPRLCGSEGWARR